MRASALPPAAMCLGLLLVISTSVYGADNTEARESDSDRQPRLEMDSHECSTCHDLDATYYVSNPGTDSGHRVAQLLMEFPHPWQEVLSGDRLALVEFHVMAAIDGVRRPDR